MLRCIAGPKNIDGKELLFEVVLKQLIASGCVCKVFHLHY